jgi:hypothetical protein
VPQDPHAGAAADLSADLSVAVDLFAPACQSTSQLCNYQSLCSRPHHYS